PTIARVVHGVVDVRPRRGGSQSLRAHEAMALDATGPRELVQDEEQRDVQLSRLGDLTAIEPNSARLDVQSVATSSVVQIDGIDSGRVPISIALRPGTHAIKIADEQLPIDESIELHRGEHLVRSYEPPSPAIPIPVRIPAPEASAPRDSAATLLE